MAFDAATEPLERRVLIADDDATWREALAGYLANHGLPVATAPDAASLERLIRKGPVSVVVMDVLMPPGEDGLSFCRRLSAADGPPMILMSEGADDVDRIVGLELGADDYIAKPCSLRELLARIRAVLRRTGPVVSTGQELTARFSGWRLDLIRRELRDPRGQLVALPPAEYALLCAMVDRPQRILTREQLVEYALRNGISVSDRAIDVRICRLRKIFGEALIHTVRGHGYMFAERPVVER